MTSKLTRIALSYAFVARKVFYRHSSLVYHFTKLKSSRPVLLTLLGIQFSKKDKQEPIDTTMADLKAEITKADQLYEDNHFQGAIDLLMTLDDTNSEVLWRLARAMHTASGSQSGDKKSEMIREAFKYISSSLEKDDQNYSIHKWYAILLDAKSNLDGLKERVTQLEVVKNHMERAIELNPKDATSRYILGEFAFGLAELPWYQRKIVSTIFATPPTGTFEEALESFLTAESLSADFYHMNKLMIGKCYYQLKDNEKAKEFLTKAANIKVENEDDRKCKAEAESLLKKFK